jgi:lysozyme family protein
MRYGAVWPQYAKWWDEMAIKQNRLSEFTNDAQYAIRHKVTYLAVEEKTGVPWAMVAIIHRREGDGDFDSYLGNGQSLYRTTTIVPAGRGPFPSFLAGCVDALKYDGLTTTIDWRLEKQLFWMTGFNGWGYYPRPSPYIWGGTNVQVPGKYVRDRVYDPNVWDTQPGCAPLLKTIASLDSTVTFTRET